MKTRSVVRMVDISQDPLAEGYQILREEGLVIIRSFSIPRDVRSYSSIVVVTETECQALGRMQQSGSYCTCMWRNDVLYIEMRKSRIDEKTRLVCAELYIGQRTHCLYFDEIPEERDIRQNPTLDDNKWQTYREPEIVDL